MTTFNIAKGNHASRHAPGGADSLSGAYAPLAQAVPVGGATGQVLGKNSGSDGDVSWRSPAATILGSAKLTSSQACTNRCANLSASSPAPHDFALSVTVTGNGNPVEVEFGGECFLYLNGTAASSTSFVRFVAALVDATAPTVQLDAIQWQETITSDHYDCKRKTYLDTTLASGSSRTYKVLCYMSTGGGTVSGPYVQMYGRDVNFDWSVVARQG